VKLQKRKADGAELTADIKVKVVAERENRFLALG